MKKAIMILLAVLLTLNLCGCARLGDFLVHLGKAMGAGSAVTGAVTSETEPETTEAAETTAETEAETAETTAAVTEAAPAAPAEEWHYTVQVVRSEHEYKADDGTLVATKVHERPFLRLENAKGEIFTGSTPERGVTEKQLAVCRAFEEGTASSNGLWDYDIEAEGRTIYEARGNADGGMPRVFYEVRIDSVNRMGSLLSILANDYIYLGGAHPDSGYHSWNFDLEKGEFVDLRSLTDVPEKLNEAIAFEIGMQVQNSVYADGLFDNWFDKLLEKENFDVYFDKNKLTVWAQEYEIGPHALGVPMFEIPYGMISRHLNAYGEQLLDLPAADRVIGVFLEAQDFWTWLESGAPKDYDDVKTEGEIEYHRISDPNVHSLADLSALLPKYVDKAFVDEQLAKSQVLKEFDGGLYAAAVGRGGDITIASVDYEAQIDGDSGNVIVTIHRQDYDDATGKWVLTGEDDVLEYPFKMKDGRPVFATMSLIY